MDRDVLPLFAMAGARHYSQLVAWELADAVRIATLKVTRRPLFATDFKLRRQTEDAAESVCRNIAEGLGCLSHGEFARYLEMSRRSLNELCDCFRSAEVKGYVSQPDLSDLRGLSRRLYPALSNFIAYLNRTPTHQTRSRPLAPRGEGPVAFRRFLIDLLSEEPRSVSSLARDLGMKRGDVEEDVRHAIQSARAAGHQIDVLPARCKTCDFVFSTDKLAKPGRCPACKGSRLFEPMIRIARTNQR